MECCFYEYARSSESFRAEYEHRRAQDEARGRFAKLPHGFGLSMECEEYPATPWLKIPPKIRRTRVKRFFNFTQKAFSLASHQNPGFNPETGEEVALFEICWGFSVNQLVSDFTKWVKSRHKGQQAKITGLDAIVPQRLQSSAKGKLNHLGAWRLLKLMDWKQAWELTAEHLGNPLFNNQPAWTRAERNAEKFLGILRNTH